MENNEKVSEARSDNRNFTNVNNNINFTINFGDSLNLLALIAGVIFIKSVTKKTKTNKRKKALILS